jgi:thiamine-phosphate pyrophosphorylase
VHSVEAAVAAEREGVDMLVLGTVYASASHRGGDTIGLAGVRAVCDAVRLPVIAIGGITTENAADVLRAGARGVAVVGAIFDADDARRAAAELCAAAEVGANP